MHAPRVLPTTGGQLTKHERLTDIARSRHFEAQHVGRAFRIRCLDLAVAACQLFVCVELEDLWYPTEYWISRNHLKHRVDEFAGVVVYAQLQIQVRVIADESPPHCWLDQVMCTRSAFDTKQQQRSRCSQRYGSDRD